MSGGGSGVLLQPLGKRRGPRVVASERIQMFHRAFLAVVAATASMLAIAILAVGAAPAAARPAPPPAAPPGLTGEVLTMTQANQDGTNVDCVVGSRAGSATFAGNGFATGPYSGTFTSQGVVPIVPTSKDQCKDGGWQQYPQFRNQGDCVSFVETGR